MELAPEEQVFYPMPYVEGEPHLLLITNRRVVHFGDEGKQELPASHIQFVGRLSTRPFVALGIVLAFLALPLMGVGIYFLVAGGVFSSVKSAYPPMPPGDDPALAAPPEDAPEGEEAPPPEDPTAKKIAGFVMTPSGLIFLVVGLLMLRVQRHYVVLRGPTAALQIRAKTPMEQTQILATVGALQSSAKASGGMPAPVAAPAAPAVQVDDKGDPVKALQELQAARAAGKVGDEEFYAKRDILIARTRKR